MFESLKESLQNPGDFETLIGFSVIGILFICMLIVFFIQEEKSNKRMRELERNLEIEQMKFRIKEGLDKR